jgi:hypothetical protein
MSDEDREPGPGEYRARGGIIRKMVPAEVIAAVPEARSLAESEGRRLHFDFLDDDAVLRMLRLRYLDEHRMQKGGVRLGIPSAFVLMGLLAYGGAYVQYWESSTSRLVYYAAAGSVVALIVLLYVIFLTRHWSDRPRQKVRARAAAYRKIAHVAARNGADLPDFYPHYGPYPFAANYYADAAELELPDEADTR